MSSCFVFCVDNSEYMRNGDYPPSRLQAQIQAVNFIMESQPDEGRQFPSVAVVSLADCKIVATPTKDRARIANKLANLAIADNHRRKSFRDRKSNGLNIAGGIKLAVKLINNHARKVQSRKRLSHRIFVFLGSPASKSKGHMATYRKLAQRLGKKNIPVDFICLGESESEENIPVLNSFAKTLNESLRSSASNVVLSSLAETDDHQQLATAGPTSHVVTVEPGLFLADALVGSQLMLDQDDDETSADEMEVEAADSANIGNQSTDQFVAVVSIDDVMQVLAAEAGMSGANDLLIDENMASILHNFLAIEEFQVISEIVANFVSFPHIVMFFFFQLHRCNTQFLRIRKKS